MKKRDFETYQKCFRDFEILPNFSETHVFRGTIRHPYFWNLIHQLITYGSNYQIEVHPTGTGCGYSDFNQSHDLVRLKIDSSSLLRKNP